MERSTTRATACPLDCPDSCTLRATVVDGRLARIEGDRANPLTAGIACGKVANFHRYVYSDARIRKPAVRVGPKGAGEFRSISWDEAFERISASAASCSTPEAILPVAYGGSNGILSQGLYDAHYFHSLGASRMSRTICAAPSGATQRAMVGGMSGVPLSDYAKAQLIVVWGANPGTSGIHHVPVIRAAQRAGAKLVVIDPVRISLIDESTWHIQPRPGTDLVLALAMVRELFVTGRADAEFLADHTTGVEELRRRCEPWNLNAASRVTGVDSATIRELTDLYARSSPAAIRIGWGLERNRNGGAAVAALIALVAVGGKFQVEGGGYTMSNAGGLPALPVPSWVAAPPNTRVFNMNKLGEILLAASPPIELLFVYNCNPLATFPDQNRVRKGLQRADCYTIVLDQVMTDTARYADLLLPATTFVEHDDLRRAYGVDCLIATRKVIAPLAGARSNAAVFHRLALDLGAPSMPLPAEALEDVITELPREYGDPLHSGTVASRERGVLFVDEYPKTPGCKLRLFPAELDAEAPAGLYAYIDDPASIEYPIALLSPAAPPTISSSLGNLRRSAASVSMSPVDASARGVSNGDRVSVFNDLGRVICRAKILPTLRPGVAVLPKGLWSHNTENGQTANSLVPDTLTDLGGGAVFNDARVQIAPFEGADDGGAG